MLGAFKWRRNSANEAKRMGRETGKLQGLMTTVLMDSKADEKDLFRELRRQRGIRLLTTPRKGSAMSPERQRMVKVLKPALSRCNPQKNPLPSADYVASGRRTLQGRFSDEKRLC